MFNWFFRLWKPKRNLADQQKALADCRQLLATSNIRYKEYEEACRRLKEAKNNGFDEQACRVFTHNVKATKKRYDNAYAAYKEQHEKFKAMV